MTQLYATAVRQVLSALQKRIQDHARLIAIEPGEVQIGPRSRERSLLQEGVYILKPDATDPRFPLNSRRQVTLLVPVACVTRDLEDANGTLRSIDLEGLVVDAVGADPTLDGTCVIALPGASEAQEDADGADITYTTVVTVTIVLNHALKDRT